MHDTPSNLMEALRHFSNPDNCREYLASIRWPDGKVVCPSCSHSYVGFIKTRGQYQCHVPWCKRQFSAKTGTIFEGSKVCLSKWFAATWIIANSKIGVSSIELARHIGVSQTTAWQMLHRLRKAMGTPTFQKLTGIVEVDESFVGGKTWSMNLKRYKRRIQGRGCVGKAIVFGLVERGGRVRTFVVESRDAETLQSIIKQQVEHGAHVYTDCFQSYQGLSSSFVHKTVNRSKGFLKLKIHTNSIENFWKNLKRSLRGAYICVSIHHLQRYLAEVEFRYNHRHVSDSARFRQLIQWCVDT